MKLGYNFPRRRICDTNVYLSSLFSPRWRRINAIRSLLQIRLMAILSDADEGEFYAS